MGTFERDGFAMRYELVGDGPLIVGISGLLSTAATSQWRLVPGLMERYTVLLADHRGSGAGPAPPGPYSIEQLADDWIALIEHVGRAPVAVLGNSMGGLVAQSLAARRPDLAPKLVLSCTMARPDPYVADLMAHWHDVFVRMGPRAWFVCVTLWAAGTAFYNAHRDTLLDAVSAVAGDVDEAGYRAQIEAALSFDGHPLAGALTMDTLVIAGAEDRVCRPELGRALADGLGVEAVFLDGAGHLAQAEAPAAYAEHLLRFLARHEEDRRAASDQ